MKGYVLHGKGDAGWQEVPVPEIGPFDALVRPTAVATCTTDVHAIATLAFPNALGKVIGHEVVGVVDTIGELVKDFKVGDRVVLPAILADWRPPAPSAAKRSITRPTARTCPRTPRSAARSPSW